VTAEAVADTHHCSSLFCQQLVDGIKNRTSRTQLLVERDWRETIAAAEPKALMHQSDR
jgi:hypothetical protein